MEDSLKIPKLSRPPCLSSSTTRNCFSHFTLSSTTRNCFLSFCSIFHYFLMYSSFSPYPFLFIIVNLFVHLPISLCADEDPKYLECNKRFECGNIENITYPFWTDGRDEDCGHQDFKLNCQDNSAEIQFQSVTYRVISINPVDRKLRLAATTVSWNNNCPARFENISFPSNALSYLDALSLNVTLFYGCLPIPRLAISKFSCFVSGKDENYYWVNSVGPFPPELSSCTVNVTVTVRQGFSTSGSELNIENILNEGFDVDYAVDNSFCNNCEFSSGVCGYNRTSIQTVCFCYDGQHDDGNCPSQPENNGINKGRKVTIGLATGFSGIFLTCMVFIFFAYRRRQKNKLATSSTLISRYTSEDSSIKPEDPEKGSSYFQTPIFTYKELHEATNHFDTNKELGDGGFGTVYYGKLRDGRVVAVKRLFEHNYKRVEQFMNEIAILSRLRHRNLVTLYGCTNRHSRELLLVYEYVPNGTVADHLHGDRADAGLLTWPIRLNIAIESADALQYLHASDTIHRDVKTNNILLDDGFHVKVADFGLSRLFPTDVTHVSTAPQGTPGYVDPEYYQCYQLNDRSDVYSFGVVLIELISSKPAVDIGRHRHEINLANMAINKIHNQAIHELVDPCLGFESDYTVRNTITLVAELAFRCLQQEKEMRPCMVEVLETLRNIESADYKKKTADEMDISADARLLKNSQPLSPDSVVDKWHSKSTTPNTSN